MRRHIVKRIRASEAGQFFNDLYCGNLTYIGISPLVLNPSNYSVLDPYQILNKDQLSTKKYNYSATGPKESFVSVDKPVLALFTKDVCTLVDRTSESSLFKDIIKCEMKLDVKLADCSMSEYTVTRDSELFVSCITKNALGLIPTEICNGSDKLSAYGSYKLKNKQRLPTTENNTENLHKGRRIPRWDESSNTNQDISQKERVFSSRGIADDRHHHFSNLVSKEKFNLCDLYNTKLTFKQKLIAENKVSRYLDRYGICGTRFGILYQTYQHSSFYGLEFKESKARNYQPDWQATVNRAICRHMAVTNIPNHAKLLNQSGDNLVSNDGGSRGWSPSGWSQSQEGRGLDQPISEIHDLWAFIASEPQSEYSGHDFDRGFIHHVDFIPTNVNADTNIDRKLNDGVYLFSKSKVTKYELIINTTSLEYRKAKLYLSFIEHV